MFLAHETVRDDGCVLSLGGRDVNGDVLFS